MLSRYDTLAAGAARNAPGTLSVDHSNGNILVVEVEAETTINHLKELLHEQEGLPPEQQSLVFAGKKVTSPGRAGALLHPALGRAHTPCIEALSPPRHLRAQLEDGHTLVDYGVTKGSELFLSLKLQG